MLKNYNQIRDSQMTECWVCEEEGFCYLYARKDHKNDTLRNIIWICERCWGKKLSTKQY